MPLDKDNLAITVALLVVLITVSAVTYGYYSTFPTVKPQGSLIGNLQLRSTSMIITGVNRTYISLDFRAVVYNPNGFGASLDKVNYTIYASGRYLGRGQMTHGFELAPETTQSLVFPVIVGWGSAFGTVGVYLLSWGRVTFELKGMAEIKLGQFSFAAPFDFTVA